MQGVIVTTRTANLTTIRPLLPATKGTRTTNPSCARPACCSANAVRCLQTVRTVLPKTRATGLEGENRPLQDTVWVYYMSEIIPSTELCMLHKIMRHLRSFGTGTFQHQGWVLRALCIWQLLCAAWPDWCAARQAPCV